MGEENTVVKVALASEAAPPPPGRERAAADRADRTGPQPPPANSSCHARSARATYTFYELRP